jgi:prepilin-type N-terminal cleavage/methylation domain-containing protein
LVKRTLKTLNIKRLLFQISPLNQSKKIIINYYIFSKGDFLNRITHTNSDEGFTLIELLVVILIIAILATVGIVALLGAIRSGQDSAAKQTLANAYKEVKTLEVNQDIEDGTELADVAIKLNEVSPDFTWQTTAVTGDPTNVITLGLKNSNETLFGVKSKSGKCLYLYTTSLNKSVTEDNPIKTSQYKAISKNKIETCPLIPPLNAASTGFDEDLYTIY